MGRNYKYHDAYNFFLDDYLKFRHNYRTEMASFLKYLRIHNPTVYELFILKYPRPIKTYRKPTTEHFDYVLDNFRKHPFNLPTYEISGKKHPWQIRR